MRVSPTATCGSDGFSVAVPVNAIVLEAAPVAETVIVAEWLPTAVGAYVTVISPEPETEELETENILALVPETAIEMLPVRFTPDTLNLLVAVSPLYASNEREAGLTLNVGSVV